MHCGDKTAVGTELLACKADKLKGIDACLQWILFMNCRAKGILFLKREILSFGKLSFGHRTEIFLFLFF